MGARTLGDADDSDIRPQWHRQAAHIGGIHPAGNAGPRAGYDSSAGNAGFRGSEASHSPTGCADAAAQAGNTNDFPVVGSLGMACECPG